MPKTLVCVYQDCYLCGDRGRRQKELCIKEGINLRKVGFTTEEGRKLIHEAVKHHMGSMPFFTDGEKFSYKLSDFIPKPAKSGKKSRKKPTSEKKTEITEAETENGNGAAA